MTSGSSYGWTKVRPSAFLSARAVVGLLERVAVRDDLAAGKRTASILMRASSRA
jgi:hypothetical protein